MEITCHCPWSMPSPPHFRFVGPPLMIWSVLKGHQGHTQNYTLWTLFKSTIHTTDQGIHFTVEITQPHNTTIYALTNQRACWTVPPSIEIGLASSFIMAQLDQWVILWALLCIKTMSNGVFTLQNHFGTVIRAPLWIDWERFCTLFTLSTKNRPRGSGSY